MAYHRKRPNSNCHAGLRPISLTSKRGTIRATHDEVGRGHPNYKVVRGWLYTGENIVVKHSVVETEQGVLLDVTPRRGINAEEFTRFAVWTGALAEFESLPPQGMRFPR
jgi:hypothetical protein